MSEIVAQHTETVKLTAAETRRQTWAHKASVRHVAASRAVFQAQLAARRAAENQRFADEITRIKALHGTTWQRYGKSATRRYETLIFGDPFAEDAVTIEFRETVTYVKQYGHAPNYFVASNARALFAALHS